MDANTLRTNFNAIKSSHNMSFELKDEQVDISLSVFGNRNVIGILPTGYGKTLCIVLPSILKMNTNPITLVISPLTSLIDDQISSLEKWNIKCAKIGALSEMEKDTISGIQQGHFHVVFSSPESVLKPYWKKIFLGHIWQERLHMVAVDEAHCISEWGEDFRTDYRDLADLRSFFNVPVMALTATSTQKVKNDIMEHLQLTQDDTDIVFKSPDRPNIYIEIKKKENTDYDICLKWLIDHIREKGVHAKKIIVYCRSIDKVSEIFLTLKDSLGLFAYVNQEKVARNILVEMYHKSTAKDSKDRILSEFKQQSSTIRCVVATVALGMGMDIRDIDIEVHIGCPKSILSYWQEAGRCARDGRKGLSFILYDNFTTSLKTTGECISSVIRNTDDSCIRQQIVNLLSVDTEIKLSTTPCEGCDLPQCQCSACNCCSVCSKGCPCQDRCNFDIEKFINTEMTDLRIQLTTAS